jgi:hypothetical protein
MVRCWPVVCQFVPFVLLLQETQVFQPQSRQVGAKVPCQICQGGHDRILVSTTSSVIISTKYSRNVLVDWSCRLLVALHCLFSPWGPLYYTSLRARGPCPLRRGWCLDLLTWPTLKNFLFIRGTWRDLTAECLTTGWLGGPVAGVTPLVHLEYRPHPQRWYRSRPLKGLDIKY